MQPLCGSGGVLGDRVHTLDCSTRISGRRWLQVNQMWVTQLQLEMLAAPAQSALLVSRSASKVSSHSSISVHRIYFKALHGPRS